MPRGLTVLLLSLAAVAACSNDSQKSMTATSPSAIAAPEPGSLLGVTSVAPGGVSGKYDVSFPGRDQSFDFRNQLETKYLTGLGRSPAPTFVDREGEVVWTQEYMRYRVNGCDHASATQRVLAQVDGQAAGAVCGAPPDGAIAFPPRNEAFDFRRQLESRYQQFLRGATQSSVDAEGGVIWTQEYLRYRVNQCDHATSVQKVFSQIDGGPVPATCFVAPCAFTIAPTTQTVPVAGGTFSIVVTRASGSCSFLAESLDSFVTITGGATGSSAPATVTYTVGRNFGSARTARIRVRWENGSTLLEIHQEAGTAVAFTLTDTNAGSGTTTNCAIRTAATPCVLNVSSGVFSSSAVFTWRVEYGSISHDSTGTSTSFQFTPACGTQGATAAGNQIPLNVSLSVADGGTTVDVRSGVGAQPSLTATFFTCPS